jgi:hypothetical protein
MSAIATRLTLPPWTRTRLASGAWRCQHTNGSVIFIGSGASEAEIQHQLAEAEAMIARLARRRFTP